jgi:hypothetical protein
MSVKKDIVNAIYKKDISKIKQLMETIDERDIKKFLEEPFSIAASQAELDIIELMLTYDVDINSSHALFYACSGTIGEVGGEMKKNRMKVIKLLLEKGADIDACCSDDERNSLMIASQIGFKEVVKLLLENGADKNIVIGGYSALLYAIEEGHTDIAEMINESD